MIALQIVALEGLTVLSGMGLLAASGLSWLAWFNVLTVIYLQGRSVIECADACPTFRCLQAAANGWQAGHQQIPEFCSFCCQVTAHVLTLANM
jgi:hypothetical protein